MSAPDRDVLTHAAHVIMHKRIDELGDAALIRAHLWPPLGRALRETLIVDDELSDRGVSSLVLGAHMTHKVAGTYERASRALIVAPELIALSARPVKALLEELKHG